MRVAIVEDDTAYAQRLLLYLQRFSQENQVKISHRIFCDGRELIRSYCHDWDLILMDIEMPLLDGLSAAHQIRDIDCDVQIIFITSMAQYAINGYEVAALDYVLKPVNYSAFSMKLRRAWQIIQKNLGQSLLLRGVDGQQKVLLRDIHYIEVCNHTIRYHTGSKIFAATGSKSIKALAEEFFSIGFALCNQCYLVNLRYVDRLEKDMVYVGDTPLKISRARQKEFTTALMNYLGGGKNR